jgi:putative addiction module component (TIGR02574 family)
MSDKANQIVEQALRLESAERAAIIDRLLSSLNSPDPSVEKLWIEEARGRFAAYEAGEMKAIPAEEVYAELGLS